MFQTIQFIHFVLQEAIGSSRDLGRSGVVKSTKLRLGSTRSSVG